MMMMIMMMLPAAHRLPVMMTVVVVVMLMMLMGLGTSEEVNIIFATVVFRHGDRSPIGTYPTDPHSESDWPQGFGQLTQEGMRQQFELGQFLRERYTPSLINTSYVRSEVFVRSTDVDRTLMSVSAQLSGLYPPRGRQQWNPDLAWQPVPIHTQPLDTDRLLRFPLPGCPKYDELMVETRDSPEWRQIETDNKDFLEFVGTQAGMKNLSLDSVWQLYDTLYVQSVHNLSLPAWAVAGDTLPRLRALAGAELGFMFGSPRRVDKSRLQGGKLMSYILGNITAAANRSSPLRLQLLSAHDTTVGALLSVLAALSGGLLPPYASAVMLEVYAHGNGSVYVELWFRNTSLAPPVPVSLPSCLHRCPLDRFSELLRPLLPTDWGAECQLVGGSAAPRDNITTGLLLSVLCTLGLMLVLMMMLLLWRQRRMETGNAAYTQLMLGE